MVAVAVSVALGIAIVWAGSRGGVTVDKRPGLALCRGLTFGIHWLVFVPAYVFQTERSCDLTGSLTSPSLVGVLGDLTGQEIALFVPIRKSYWSRGCNIKEIHFLLMTS